MIRRLVILGASAGALLLAGCVVVPESHDSGSTQGSKHHSSSPAHVSLDDLVGARASSADSSLRSRGFTDRGGYKEGNKSFTTWYNASTHQCVKAVTKEGHIQRFESIAEGNCR